MNDSTHRQSFAAWNAKKWSQAAPELDSTAALVAVKLRETFIALDRSQHAILLPWKKQGVETVDDFRLLALLYHSDPPGITQHNATILLRETSENMQARVERFCESGVVFKHFEESSLAEEMLYLAEKYEPMVVQIYEALVHNHNAFFARLSSEQHDQLASLLRSI